ncbi:MAG: nucleotidyl transferase AbiEii/AbiGii toxin family protein [Candidatus Helarchaeota archaeon]
MESNYSIRNRKSNREMVIIEKNYFWKITTDSKFNVDLIEKTYHLSTILQGISQNSFLKKNLTLKGGTAINFFWTKLSRLSIDLDLYFTGDYKKEVMLKQKEQIVEEIQKIGIDLGYIVKDKKAASSYIIRRFYLKYKPIKKESDSIKIEINFLYRVPIIKRIEKKFHSLFLDKIKNFSFYTYTQEELIAMKTIALMDRKDPRDLFDIFKLIKNNGENINQNITKKAIILNICMIPRKILNSFIESKKILNVISYLKYVIAQLKQEEIKSQLINLISSNFEYDWENMKEEITKYYKKVLNFNENEIFFWNKFINESQFEPHLLSEGLNDLNKNIIHHPAILKEISDEWRKEH